MEGNSEIKLVSSMFSLYFHCSIYVFNTEGLRGALTEELLKQSPAYAALLVSAHKPCSMLQRRRGHNGTRALVQFQERARVMIYYKTKSSLSC